MKPLRLIQMFYLRRCYRWGPWDWYFYLCRCDRWSPWGWNRCFTFVCVIDETLEADADVLPLYVWQMKPLRLVQMFYLCRCDRWSPWGCYKCFIFVGVTDEVLETGTFTFVGVTDEALETGADVLPLYVWQMKPLRLVQMFYLCNCDRWSPWGWYKCFIFVGVTDEVLETGTFTFVTVTDEALEAGTDVLPL